MSKNQQTPPRWVNPLASSGHRIRGGKQASLFDMSRETEKEKPGNLSEEQELLKMT